MPLGHGIFTHHRGPRDKLPPGELVMKSPGHERKQKCKENDEKAIKTTHTLKACMPRGLEIDKFKGPYDQQAAKYQNKTNYMGTRAQIASRVMGDILGRGYLLFKQCRQRRARGLDGHSKLRHFYTGLLVVVINNIAVADGLEVKASVVRGDDGQRTLDTGVESLPKPAMHLAIQGGQAALDRATCRAIPDT